MRSKLCFYASQDSMIAVHTYTHTLTHTLLILVTIYRNITILQYVCAVYSDTKYYACIVHPKWMFRQITFLLILFTYEQLYTFKEHILHAFSFCQLSRDDNESLGSSCSSSCSADKMRRCEAALREWNREDAVQMNHSYWSRMTD